jgi:hypothetical protein
MVNLSDTASKSWGVTICNVYLLQCVVDLRTIMTLEFEHPTKCNCSGRIYYIWARLFFPGNFPIHWSSYSVLNGIRMHEAIGAMIC